MVGTAAAIAGGIGSIGSAVIGSAAAGSAADQQAAAAREANKMQWDMYQQTRKDNEPWRQAGQKALGDLGNADYMRDFTQADFQQDPGYAFRMAEGQKALERSAAARGGLQSGGTLKAISRYGQDFASNEYQNAYNRFNADRDRRFNRLSSIAGVGQTANSQVANAGMNYANQAGANSMGAANAAGAAGIAQANAWGNSLGNIGKTWMDMHYINRAFPQQETSSLREASGSPYKPGNTYSGYGLGFNGNYGIV